MRFTCEKSALVQGLNIAGRTVAVKSGIPALEGILCQGTSSGISLTGYNMETAITCLINAEVPDGGECIFPARLFGDIVRRLPEGPVTVVIDDNNKVSIRAGYASFTISAESADEYPALPDVNNEGKAIRIPQNAMKELIGGTIFAVSESPARPVHNGIKFEVERTRVSAIALDGYRLARRTHTLAVEASRETSFIVPAVALKEVEKILSDTEDNVILLLSRRHILFQIGTVTLICRTLTGDFLDWRKVVPTDCPIKLVANVSELASSVERVGLIVTEKYKSPVRCIFGNQSVQMRTQTSIGAAEDKCSYAGDGKELEIGFNARYLSDALKAVPADEVVLELTNNLSPIVLTPAGGDKEFSYMILPVRIKV